jgi:hypothetical protein
LIKFFAVVADARDQFPDLRFAKTFLREIAYLLLLVCGYAAAARNADLGLGVGH